MEIILQLLAAMTGQGMKVSGGPALVLKKFQLRTKPQRRDPIVIEAIGRRSGLMAFLLNLFGLDPTTYLTITQVEVTKRSTSVFGQSMDVIPIKEIASVHASASSPIALIFMAIFVAVLGLPLLAMEPASYLGPLVVAGAFVVGYFLQGHKFTLGIQSRGGTSIAMSIKPKVVDGKTVDVNTLQTVVIIIRELVIASHGGGTMAPLADTPMSLDDEEEPIAAAEEVYEVTAVEDDNDIPFSESPAPAAKKGNAFSFDEPSAQVGDPEEEAREMFKQGAELFKANKKKEAIALWEKLVRRYPNTQAGQAAMRNLEKLRG